MIKYNLPKCIVIDTNFLIAAVSPKTSEDDRARIDNFFAGAEKVKAKIIIPMPVVAEYLVGSDIAGVETLNRLEKKAYIFAAPFDRAAAFECAQLERAARGSGDKRDGEATHWQKIKIDRQIVAIGKSCGATMVISADKCVRNNASRLGMTAKTIQELDLPNSAKQGNLPLP